MRQTQAITVHATLLFLLLLLAARPQAEAQVIHDWDSPSRTDTVITSVELDSINEDDFSAGGIIQDWRELYEDFENTPLSDLSGYIEDMRRTREREKKEQEFRNVTTPDGIRLTLPRMTDENGVDLFLLTEDGISICLLLSAPSFFTDPADMSPLIRWIRYYAYGRRRWTATILRRFGRYEKEFRDAFAGRGVPQELTLLTLQESGCNPDAVSSAGAVGIWQLMPATARLFGLRVDGTRDDRYDNAKATAAAARLLQANYRRLGSWTLALAAYNCGAARVSEAIAKARGSRRWEEVERFLPKETRNYVPGIIALHYIWTYRSELGF